MIRHAYNRLASVVASVIWTEDRTRARAPWRIVVPLIPALAIAVGVMFLVGDALSIPALIFVSQLTLAVTVFVLFAASTRYLDRGRSIWEYGLRFDRRWGSDLVAGFLIGIVAVAVPYVVGIAMGWFEISAVLSPGPVGLWVGVVVIILAYLCTGFWEELFFRGVLMVNAAEGLRRRLSPRSAIAGVLILQAVIFGVIHVEQWTAQAPHPAFVTTWILSGFVFGLLYLLANDLALPIGVHAAGNAAGASLFSEHPPADGGMSVIVLVDPLSQSMLLGHGGLMMISSNLIVGVLGVLWLWVSRDSGLDLWTHPAFFVGERDPREP